MPDLRPLVRAWLLPLCASLVLAGCGSMPVPVLPAIPALTTPLPAPTPARLPARPALTLATTTGVQDSGLLDVLLPDFAGRTGYRVQVVAVEAARALQLGAQGQADVLLVDAPAAEQAFVAGGAGVDRRLVMHGDFVIVGPPADPGNIRGRKALSAFRAIADVGGPFVSRGDGSAPAAVEAHLWTLAGIDPAHQPWYSVSGQSMRATLTLAGAQAAYTLSDRAGYLALSRQIGLAVLAENDPLLIDIYHVVGVNPQKWPGVNVGGAQAFADYLLSPAGQQFIGTFGLAQYRRAVFVPDAGKREDSLGH